MQEMGETLDQGTFVAIKKKRAVSKFALRIKHLFYQPMKRLSLKRSFPKSEKKNKKKKVFLGP